MELDGNTGKVLLLCVAALFLSGYLSQIYSFKVGAVYGLLTIFCIVAYLVFKFAPEFVVPLLIAYVPIWYMVNGDFTIGATATIGLIAGAILVILYKKFA